MDLCGHGQTCAAAYSNMNIWNLKFRELFLIQNINENNHCTPDIRYLLFSLFTTFNHVTRIIHVLLCQNLNVGDRYSSVCNWQSRNTLDLHLDNILYIILYTGFQLYFLQTAVDRNSNKYTFIISNSFCDDISVVPT